MNAKEARRNLDSRLKRSGQDATIERLVGVDLAPVSVSLRVSILDFEPEILAKDSSLQIGDRKLVCSTTEMDRAQWPNIASEDQPPGDPRVLRRGDRVTLASGKVYIVERGWEAPRVFDELIRIEAHVR